MDTLQVVLRAIASLVVVVGLIMWLSRRFADAERNPGIRRGTPAPGTASAGASLLSPRRWARTLFTPGKPASPSPIQVAGRHMLSNKVQLVVVDIDGQRLVLSVADSGATVLHTSAHPADDTAPTASEEVATDSAVTPQPEQAAPDVTMTDDFDRELHDQLVKNTNPTRSRIDGSILSPNTWRQAKAAMKAARVGRPATHTQLTPPRR